MFIKNKNIKGKKIINFKSRSRKWEMNIAVIVFIAIFIYIIGICYNYFTAHNISTYEVRYGSIINDTEYTGLAIREEVVYKAAESGYIQFYYLNGSRVSYDNSLYTIASSNEDVVEQASVIASSEDDLTTSTLQSVLSEIQSFNSSYSNNAYGVTYDVTEDLNAILENIENTIKINVLDSLDDSTANFNIYRSDQAGIICYGIDGYEGVTVDNFTSDMLEQSNYTSSTVVTGDSVTSNASIYKLITDESWQILFQINEIDIDIFEEESKVEIKFVSDGESTTADFEIMELDGDHYGVISMNKNMIRYSNERFIDIELIFDELEGYKIPKSSVISREFYQVPLDYITRGGDSSSNGVVAQNEDGSVEFIETNVYYQDSDYGYILASTLPINQTIIMEETSEKLVLDSVIELNGVYNINKGYAEFKCVTILTESAEYYIVDESMSYSISNYDRIALYGDSVEEFVVIN